MCVTFKYVNFTLLMLEGTRRISRAVGAHLYVE